MQCQSHLTWREKTTSFPVLHTAEGYILYLVGSFQAPLIVWDGNASITFTQEGIFNTQSMTILVAHSYEAPFHFV